MFPSQGSFFSSHLLNSLLLLLSCPSFSCVFCNFLLVKTYKYLDKGARVVEICNHLFKSVLKYHKLGPEFIHHIFSPTGPPSCLV